MKWNILFLIVIMPIAQIDAAHDRGFFNDIEQEIYDSLPAIGQNPYKDTIASVRIGNNLCQQENEYIAKRIPKVRACLSNVGISLGNNTPVIAVACSGGGYRAMLYTIGALKALDESGLMDSITYLVGLSGSTWAIGTWISSGKSVSTFHDWIIDSIGSDMKEIDDDDIALIDTVLLTKYAAGQSIGFVDVYGACIANDLFDFFSSDKERVYLSDQASKIADGSLPFPLYTAISAQNPSEQFWYEFDPYEIGAPWLNAYVPTWAFGRQCNNGVSTSNAPEQSLGTLFGTFGLAVGVTFKELVQDTDIADSMKTALAKKILQKLIADFGSDRPIYAEYYNFVYGLSTMQFNNQQTLDMVDAGIDFNLPYPPISGQRPERKADIIIFVDASAGTVGAELQNVENYARANNLPFPVIDYASIGNNAVSIFKSDDPQVPVVIYVPRIVDHGLLEAHKNDLPDLYSYLNNFDIEKCIAQGACDTFNFSYTPDQARQVTALGEFNMLMAKESLLQVVNIENS